MTATTAESLSGDVMQIPTESGTPLIKSRKTYDANRVTRSTCSRDSPTLGPARRTDYLDGPSATTLAKEWSLTNPINTGILAFDLEAPGGASFPRQSPIRNSLPAWKGGVSSRRFKVIFDYCGRGRIAHDSAWFQRDHHERGSRWVVLHQAALHRVHGLRRQSCRTSRMGFRILSPGRPKGRARAIRIFVSLSSTTLLYSTMLLQENDSSSTGVARRPMATRVRSAPPQASRSLVSARRSRLPGRRPWGGNEAWVVVAADAGDMLGTTGAQMHQGPATAAASVSLSAGQAIQVTVGQDVAGALRLQPVRGSVSLARIYTQVGLVTTSAISSRSHRWTYQYFGAARISRQSGKNFDGMITTLSRERFLRQEA